MLIFFVRWTPLLVVFCLWFPICTSFIAVLWLDVVLTSMVRFCVPIWTCASSHFCISVLVVLLRIRLHLGVVWALVCWTLLSVWLHVGLLRHNCLAIVVLHMPCIWRCSTLWVLLCYSWDLSVLCLPPCTIITLLVCIWVLGVCGCWVPRPPCLNGLASYEVTCFPQPCLDRILPDLVHIVIVIHVAAACLCLRPGH